uniref:GRF-type domain-containing protein n=1 Tax=Nelumbo nucifera TaxID=4432 RepID=A0A822ZXY5_NELNU|nr:TPA_asm: hypothetical protein HUJ06_018152 [Nelumbo nucifera]
MMCPYDIGLCRVFTSKKPSSQGKRFWVCAKTQDAGGCKFFSWVTLVDSVTMKVDDGSGPSRINERSSIDTLDEIVAVVQSEKDILDRMFEFCDKLLKRIKDLRIKNS